MHQSQQIYADLEPVGGCRGSGLTPFPLAVYFLLPQSPKRCSVIQLPGREVESNDVTLKWIW